MYNNRKILAIVPARGGSKGVPHKNIRDFDGRPLIYWTLDEVIQSKYIDKCVVSTEDEEILRIIKKYDVKGRADEWLMLLRRPSDLADDSTPSVEPVLHAVNNLPGYDYIVLLQATSPMRTAEDIDGCIEYCLDAQTESCVSICEADISPWWMYTLGDSGVVQPLLTSNGEVYQRQLLPKVYQLNGAVYVVSTNFLQRERAFVSSKTLGYVMEKSHSGDIDTLLDFDILAYLHSKL